MMPLLAQAVCLQNIGYASAVIHRFPSNWHTLSDPGERASGANASHGAFKICENLQFPLQREKTKFMLSEKVLELRNTNAQGTKIRVLIQKKLGEYAGPSLPSASNTTVLEPPMLIPRPSLLANAHPRSVIQSI